MRWLLVHVVPCAPAALELLKCARHSPAELPARHLRGDWGEAPPEGGELVLAILQGFRIISSYPVGEVGERISIITEADRLSTCILLPAEY